MNGRLGTVARLLGAAVPALLWALLAAGPASADGGPHVVGINSGASTLTADSCAGCHRAHTASGESLVRTPDTVALCLTCHGSPAVGSTTNVIDGLIARTQRGLKAGGFSNALMDTAWGAVPISRPTTSAHLYDGTSSAMIWGSGAIGSGPGKPAVTLACDSCHNPHGNGQYRVLRPIPTGSDSLVPAPVGDEVVKRYDVSSPSNRYFGEVYFQADLQAQNTLDRWCASCHMRYDAPTPGAARTSSGDPIFNYRHRTAYNTSDTNCQICHHPEAANHLDISEDTAHVTTCQNCHVAHGSAAQMGTFSGTVAWPDGATIPSGNARSSLLRLDNRGVCGACHDPTLK